MNSQWKWVPVEPTREQRNAVCMHPDLAHTLYCSMVSAAPEPPDKEEAEVIGYRVRYEQNPEAEYLMYQQPEGAYSSEPIILLGDHRPLVARLTAERDALQQRLTVQDQRVDELEAALKFYADREHYHFESGNWDTVSGEPLNILWCGDEPDFIEDGSVARAALNPTTEAASHDE